jgi:hypothetical protein
MESVKLGSLLVWIALVNADGDVLGSGAKIILTKGSWKVNHFHNCSRFVFSIEGYKYVTASVRYVGYHIVARISFYEYVVISKLILLAYQSQTVNVNY